jgi:hypothetical protein
MSQSVAERGGLGDADGDAPPAGGFAGVVDGDAKGVAAGEPGTAGEAAEPGCVDVDGAGAAAPGTAADGVGVIVGTYTVGIADGSLGDPPGDSCGDPAGDASGDGDAALLATGITAVPTPYV